MILTLLAAIGDIVLVDLALSGDNALVIGVAAAALPNDQRRFAIVAGGAVAIVLRIIFATAATFLLRLPLLQAIGGVALLFIAMRMLLDRAKEERFVKEELDEEAGKPPSQPRKQRRQRKLISGQTTLYGALATIVVADLTMSLDNVLAIGALADGNLLVLVVGLLLSVSLLLVGSALVAQLMGRLPWLLDIATFVLAWTAGNMFLQDSTVGPYLKSLPGPDVLIPIALVVILVVMDGVLYLARRSRRPPSAVPAPV